MKITLTSKILRMSLCLMCLMFSSISLCAATKFTIGDLTYTVADDGAATCCVSDCKETATQVTIPSEVEYDGKSYSVSYIDNNAFRYYTNLRSVTIPNTVNSIRDYAFAECRNLTAVTIPDSITSIGGFAFMCCDSLTSVIIPNSVTYIGDFAFALCKNLTSVTIPNSVTYIGSFAFGGCKSLASVTIGSGVTSINESAFAGCSSLPSITIPKNVITLGDNVFSGCTSLSNVNIADRDTELTLGYNNESGEPQFSDCPLKNVYIGGNIAFSSSPPFARNTYLEKVKFGDEVTGISENEFFGCTNIKEVTIGDGIEKIGHHAFSDCSGLASIVFSSSVTDIESFAFSGCKSLTHISLPSSITTIGQYAFENCTGLNSVYTNWNNPIDISVDVFGGIANKCILHVPKGTYMSYLIATGWKDFQYIVEGETSGVEGLTVDDNANGIARYNLNGTRLTAPQKGINVVRMSDGTTKKVLIR